MRPPHEIVLMSVVAKARKYLAPDILVPQNKAGTKENRAELLVRELQAAGSSPSLVLAEALQEEAPNLDTLDQEIGHAHARRRADFQQPPTPQIAARGLHVGAYGFAGQYERYKDYAAVLPCQAVAAIHQFFYGEIFFDGQAKDHPTVPWRDPA